jgi:DNA-binding MarR family transcriptional regulator
MNKSPKTGANDSRRLATVQYIDNTGRFPRVRLFFRLLTFADTLNKYAGLEVRKKGDNRTGLAVLQILLKYPDGISQQEIARQTGRTKQAIVMAINKLEQKKYLKRRSNSRDKRMNSVIITQEGIDHLNEVFPHTLAMCDNVLSFFSPEEIDQFITLSGKLMKRLWQQIEAESSELAQHAAEE